MRSLLKLSSLFLLTQLLLLLVVQASHAECDAVAREALSTRFASQWFNDVRELDAHWLQLHTHSRLPLHKQHFCAEREGRVVSGRISGHSSMTGNNTLAFANPPGPVGGGMCWLHSRLQRQFTYLANYRPEQPRPTPAQAAEIIDRIVHRRGVTEIPGFRNLHEFSHAYERELTSAIDGMGWACVVNPNDCAARFGDSYHPSAQDTRDMMDRLYDLSVHSPGDVHMLRSRRAMDASSLGRGFIAHSALVTSMRLLEGPSRLSPHTGYVLRVIDPNYPNVVEEVTYRYGDTGLTIGGIVVHPALHYEYAGDVPEMNALQDQYCRP